MSRKSRRGGGVVALLQAQNKLLEERLARQDAAIAALARAEPAVTTVLPPPTLRELEAGLAAQAQAQVGGPLVKLGRRRVHVFTADLQVPDPAGDQVAGADKIRVVLPGGTQAQAEVSLAKSARRELESAAPGSIERLAFDQDPNAGQGYEGVYIPKRKLVPDDICKRIAIVEDLVACIVGGRAFQMSHFGKPRPDRFSFGFVIQPTPAQLAKMAPQEREALEAKIDKAVNRLYHCGDEEGWDHSDRMTLSEWLFQSARNAVTVGRLATEIISTRDPLTDELRFRGFRPVDAGSIYRAAPQAAHATETVREQSRTLLENVKGHKFDADRFDVKNAPGNFFERWDADEFRWVQVIDSRPVQVFTDAEMRCKNLYAVLDWETNGYPVTPIDNAYVAISTRLNITTHNKNYFLHGRASRGMLVIQSEDVDEAVIKDLKQHLQANVNGVGNAWRMPVFGVGQNDKVTWCPFDQGTKDMEFQYLSDNNSRTILSVFQMSPEEIPGYSHLSRGSNSQALSECLTLSTRIQTKDGLLSLGEILGEAQEHLVTVWNGTRWVPARVFRSGEKRLVRTELACGLVLESSPDHRFRALDDAGELSWIHQEDLVVGTVVLVASEFNDVELDAVLLDNGYRADLVANLVDLEQVVEMADVEMFDEDHGFVAEGILVHNSNQEYRLEAHRDLGIRPLIGFFEDFINTELLPLVAPDLVGLCQVKLDGLEADTAEKEAVRIQQDLVHSTYNEVLHRTEKRPIGKDLAGDVPLNQQWQATADKFALVGHLRERLMGDEHAKDDIAWRYARDPFWFQQQQWIQGLLGALPQMFGPGPIPQLAPPLIRALLPYVSEQQAGQLAQAMAQNIAQQMAQQAAQAAQAAQSAQAAPGGQEGGGGGAEQEGGGEEPQEQAGDDSGGQEQEQQEGGEPAQPAQGGEDLTRSLDQAIAAMSKGEAQLPPAKRKILRQHRRFVQQTVASLDRELGDLLGDKN